MSGTTVVVVALLLFFIGQIAKPVDWLEIQNQDQEAVQLSLVRKIRQAKEHAHGLVEQLEEVSGAIHQPSMALLGRIQEIELLAEQQQEYLEHKTSEAEHYAGRLAELNASGDVLLLVENVELSEGIQEMNGLAGDQHQKLQDMAEEMESKTNLLQGIETRVRRVLEVTLLLRPFLLGTIKSWVQALLVQEARHACVCVCVILIFPQPLVTLAHTLLVGSVSVLTAQQGMHTVYSYIPPISTIRVYILKLLCRGSSNVTKKGIPTRRQFLMQ